MGVCVFFNIILKACFKILEKYVMESWTYDPWYENGFVMLLIHKKTVFLEEIFIIIPLKTLHLKSLRAFKISIMCKKSSRKSDGRLRGRGKAKNSPFYILKLFKTKNNVEKYEFSISIFCLECN